MDSTDRIRLSEPFRRRSLTMRNPQAMMRNSDRICLRSNSAM